MIAPIQGAGQSTPALRPTGQTAQDGFDQILKRESLKFSQHAQDRIQRDGIQLSSQDLDRIQNGMDRAAGKGARESLLLMDDVAFIANVRERVVITSMHRDRLKENVFTKIDSAVIL